MTAPRRLGCYNESNMTGWVVQIIAASGMIAAGTRGVIGYVQSLPPRPEQSAVACRDAAWEKENLAETAGRLLHKKLVPFAAKLITDARTQGAPLNITVAYRSCDHQLSLRKMNCGLGDYNLYQKPSNQCTPPTEPAGKSLHNEGLAVDFNCQGYSLIERSPCLAWLDKNAARYHLFKHPIEPWHWSTTGK